MPSNGTRNAQPMSSALLRRLAEAADGFRNVGPVFFFARPKENRASNTLFDISHGYRATRIPGALALVQGVEVRDSEGKKVSREARIAGALGELEEADRTKFQKFIEAKEGSAIEYDLYGPYETDDGKSAGVVITEIILKVRTQDREGTVTIPVLNGDGEMDFDCMFWSLSAVQKFAVPYYTRVSGMDVAARMEESFLDDSFFLTIHKPVTEWVNVAQPTFPEGNDVGVPQRASGQRYQVRRGGVVAEDAVHL